MNFLEKIDFLMLRDGLNKHTLSQKSGIPYTTIVGFYERGYENVRISTLDKLCEFFSVSMDYLVYDQYERPEDFKPGSNRIPVQTGTKDEEELIVTYRSLNDAGKGIVLNTAKGLSGNPDMQKEEWSIETA